VNLRGLLFCTQAVVRQIADCVLLVRDVMARIGAREGQP